MEGEGAGGGEQGGVQRRGNGSPGPGAAAEVTECGGTGGIVEEAGLTAAAMERCREDHTRSALESDGGAGTTQGTGGL